jgi:hypothetical protein
MTLLSSKMENGATVSDWLGTAACAARVAASRIEGLRNGEALSATTLALIQEDLDQAASEMRTITAHIAGEPIQTKTTFGTVTRFPNGTTAIYGAGQFGPENQLHAWANQSGASWPCSVLAGLDDIAVSFDAAGDLLEISGDDRDGIAELPADELNAWASECLIRAGYPNHPAIR